MNVIRIYTVGKQLSENVEKQEIWSKTKKSTVRAFSSDTNNTQFHQLNSHTRKRKPIENMIYISVVHNNKKTME